MKVFWTVSCALWTMGYDRVSSTGLNMFWFGLGKSKWVPAKMVRVLSALNGGLNDSKRVLGI